MKRILVVVLCAVLISGSAAESNQTKGALIGTGVGAAIGAGIGAALGAGATSVETAEKSEDMTAKTVPRSKTTIEGGQVWSGYYLCGKNNSILNLKIVDINSNQINAIFDFNVNGAIGAYKLSGIFKKETNSLTLNPTEWILKPRGFVMVGLTGELNNSNQMFGSINYKGCSEFHISLQNENIELPHVVELRQRQKQLEKEREAQKQRQAEYEASLPEVLVFGIPLHSATKNQLKKAIEKAGGKLTHDLPEKNFMQFTASKVVPGVKHIIITYTNDNKVSSYAYVGIKIKTANDIFKTLRAKYGQADTQSGFAKWYCKNKIEIEFQSSAKSLADMDILSPEMDLIYTTSHFKQYAKEEMIRKKSAAKKDSESRKGNQAF